MTFKRPSDEQLLNEQAQQGRAMIENAILSLLATTEAGLSNAEIADQLGLKSSGKTGQRNYLTWSVLQNWSSKIASILYRGQEVSPG